MATLAVQYFPGTFLNFSNCVGCLKITNDSNFQMHFKIGRGWELKAHEWAANLSAEFLSFIATYPYDCYFRKWISVNYDRFNYQLT